MSDNQFIKFLINEDIYVLDEDVSTLESNSIEAESSENETEEVKQVEETTVEVVAEQVNQEKVELPTEKVDAPVIVTPVYKKILIIVADTTNEKLNLTDKKYIAKILQAVKVDLYQITLINVLNEPIADLTGVEKILAFTPNHKLDISASLYKETDYNESKLLVANPLNEIAASVELRKKLWSELQVMFA